MKSLVILSITSVLTAVFIPSAFLAGLQGEFYRQFALTIAISTILSAINSLTLSPALAAILLRPHHDTAKADWLTRLMGTVTGGFSIALTVSSTARRTAMLAPSVGPCAAASL